MFNWFKKKIELKENDSLMSSIPCGNGVKINTEIIVPDGYKCLVYHNSKCYLSLDAGKYTLNSSLAQKLFEKQEKYVKTSKHIKAIFHYICLKEREINLSIKKQRYKIKVNLTNVQQFVDFILLYNYKTDTSYTNCCIKDIIKYQIKKVPSKENLCLCNQQLEPLGFKITQLIDDRLSQTTIKSFKFTQASGINIMEPVNEIGTQCHMSKFDTNSNEYSVNKEQSENCCFSAHSANINSTSCKNEARATTQCPKCKHEIKFKTTYCIRCGYKLE